MFRIGARGAPLAVLLYHRVADDESDPLAVNPDRFAEQMAVIRDRYALIDGRGVLAARSRSTRERLDRLTVWVTFDDATVDFGAVAAPILDREGVPATLFVPTASLGRTATWMPQEDARFTVLDGAALRELATRGFELGLHSHRHLDFSDATPTEIGTDLAAAWDVVDHQRLPVSPILAYPYGRMPRERGPRSAIATILTDAEIDLALRVGTRHNRWPIREPHELFRIPISNAHDGARLIERIERPRRSRRG